LADVGFNSAGDFVDGFEVGLTFVVTEGTLAWVVALDIPDGVVALRC
jgi:hypothetical protein